MSENRLCPEVGSSSPRSPIVARTPCLADMLLDFFGIRLIRASMCKRHPGPTTSRYASSICWGSMKVACGLCMEALRELF